MQANTPLVDNNVFFFRTKGLRLHLHPAMWKGPVEDLDCHDFCLAAGLRESRLPLPIRSPAGHRECPRLYWQCLRRRTLPLDRSWRQRPYPLRLLPAPHHRRHHRHLLSHWLRTANRRECPTCAWRREEKRSRVVNCHGPVIYGRGKKDIRSSRVRKMT